jgi:hypothetical protein
VGSIPADKTRRWQIVIWSGMMALAVFLSLRDYDTFQVGAARDDGYYVVLARSLVGDRGFGMINTPGDEPSSSPYPVGYPLTLAPLVALAPDNLEILKLTSLLATLANGALLFWGWQWFSRRSGWWGVAIAGLYVLSPSAVALSRMVMSEAVFTPLCLLAMLLAEQVARGKAARRRSFLLGAVLAYAIFTRSVGVIIAAALAVYLLWRKGRAGWQAIGMAGAAGLILAVFILLLTPVKLGSLLPSRYLTERNNSLYLIEREAFAGTGAGTQSDDLPGSTQERTVSTPLRVLERVRRHLTVDLREAVLPVGGGEREQALALRLGMPWLSMAVCLLTLGLVVVGWLTWWVKDGMTAFGFGAVVYCAAILLWNWSGARLLYPVMPQLLLCFLIGCEATCRFVSAAAMRRPPTVPVAARKITAETLPRAFILVVAVIFGCLTVRMSLRIPDSRLYVGDLSTRTDWLRANTPASAVVMSEEPVIDFLYSGRHTVSQPQSFSSTADLESFLTREHVDYIFVGPSLKQQLRRAPDYSRSTALLLPLLAELQAAGRLAEVHYSPEDRMVVYKPELQ